MRIASALPLLVSLVAGFASPTLAAEQTSSKSCRQAGGGRATPPRSWQRSENYGPCSPSRSARRSNIR